MATGVKERKKTNPILKIVKFVVIVALIIAIAAGGMYMLRDRLVSIPLLGDIYSLFFNGEKEQEGPQVVNISELERIINVSELSTFTAVYNGVAEVMNGDKPDQTDYYVSYNATVKAMMDFSKIAFGVDEEKKEITAELPEFTLATDVKIGSLDFIFNNKKANTATVSEEAYKACIADAQRESEDHGEIIDLARQNAANTVKALLNPIVEQCYPDYTVTVK